jgi:deoxycytidine triphosphate deaminase
MFLGKAEILRRIEDEKLLEDLDIDNVQGAGVEFEIDRLFEAVSGASLSRDSRRLPELREIRADTFTLKPGKYYLCTTREKVNMPKDFVAFIFQRSTLFRCGASLRTAVVDPGYDGILTLGLKNESDKTFYVERHSPICQIVLCEVKGRSEPYSGRYQGGRVT